jgi:hypothetical protein
MNMSGLYVCLFSNGTVKVGMGKNPEIRIRSHRLHGEVVGVDMVRSYIANCQGSVHDAERELIKWCAERCTKRMASEWFIGIDFDQSVEKAKECAANAPIPKKTKQDAAGDVIDAIFANLRGPAEDRENSRKFRDCLKVAQSLRDCIIDRTTFKTHYLSPIEEINGASYFEVISALLFMEADRAERAEFFNSAIFSCESEESLVEFIKDTHDYIAKKGQYAQLWNPASQMVGA